MKCIDRKNGTRIMYFWRSTHMTEMGSCWRVLGTRQALTSGFNAEIMNVMVPNARIDPLCGDYCHN